jgi:hypothetical protein
MIVLLKALLTNALGRARQIDSWRKRAGTPDGADAAI